MSNLYELFNNKASLYANSRPSYSDQIITYLKEWLKLDAFHICADIGAGSGQLTHILAENFDKVYVIEPNLSMLEECQNRLVSYKNIVFKCSKAENTNLKSNFFDFVTVAQAIHLFDTDETYNEFKRILKPNGKLFIVYNMKNHNSELFKASEEVLLRYCPLYKRELHATEFSENTFKERFTKKSYNYVCFLNDNTEFLNCETFITRTLSASYSITPEASLYRKYVEALEDVFNSFEKNNKVKVELSTVIYSGILR